MRSKARETLRRMVVVAEKEDAEGRQGAWAGKRTFQSKGGLNEPLKMTVDHVN